MSALKRLGLLTPDEGTWESRTAFLHDNKLDSCVQEEKYGVSPSGEGGFRGCRVPVTTVNIHCHGPHIECASHILKFPTSKVSDCLLNGSLERALLVTPRLESRSEAGESYPIGDPGEMVVTSRQLNECLLESDADTAYDSIIVRIESDYLPCHVNSTDIAEWPYLTLEAMSLVRSKFRHYRTNAPSVERRVSDGGMWCHALFFGVDESSRQAEIVEMRTIGELFHIPDSIPDGKYILQCPFLELGLDAAPVVPILYEWLG